jgi:hypothetical protein
VEDNRIQAHMVKATEAQSKLVKLCEDAPIDLDDCKLGRLQKIRGSSEDMEVLFNFMLGAEGVEEAGDGVLEGMVIIFS